MKKLILLVIAISISMIARAWKVGDYYDADGIPSIIVWVDDSGEHGLRMAPRIFYDFKEDGDYAQTIEQSQNKQNQQEALVNSKFAQKQVNKRMDAQMDNILANLPEGVNKEEFMRQMQLMQNQGMETVLQQEQDKLLEMQDNISVEDAELVKQGINATEYDPMLAYRNAQTFCDRLPYQTIDYSRKKIKLMKKYDADLLSTNNGSGKNNTNNVIDYCKSNNIDIDLYFPAYSYAKSLGDHWFIPGNDELELIAQAISNGVGKEYKQSRVELTKKIASAYIWMKAEGFFPYKTLGSSTMVKSAWSSNQTNKSKCDKAAKDGTYSLQLTNDYMDFTNQYYVFSYQTNIYCPVCEF